MAAELSGDYVPIPLPDEVEKPEPVLRAIAQIAMEEPSEERVPEMTSWQHRQLHGLCYRNECVARYGMPLIMKTWVQWTPHG